MPSAEKVLAEFPYYAREDSSQFLFGKTDCKFCFSISPDKRAIHIVFIFLISPQKHIFGTH